MSAGPSPVERISALEEHSHSYRDEIKALRDKAHRHASMIQANTNDLEVFKARLFGLAAGFGFSSGIIAALLIRLLFGSHT